MMIKFTCFIFRSKSFSVNLFVGAELDCHFVNSWYQCLRKLLPTKSSKTIGMIPKAREHLNVVKWTFVFLRSSISISCKINIKSVDWFLEQKLLTSLNFVVSIAIYTTKEMCQDKNSVILIAYYPSLYISGLRLVYCYFFLVPVYELSCASTRLHRGTQPEYSSKPLKHSSVERILVFKR